MIDELQQLLTSFSKVNHTRCFLHVNNLVAQSIVRQFDVPMHSKMSIVDPTDPNNYLYNLASDIDHGEQETCEALLRNAGMEEVEEDDDTDGWVDKMATLTEAERKVVEEGLRPIKLLLIKV
jgi:hypothetical protein